MPRHTDTDPQQIEKTLSWMRDWHVKGNKQAHSKADVGADLWRVPAVKARDILGYIHNLEIIQDRLIAVMTVKLTKTGNNKDIAASEGRPGASTNIKIVAACSKSAHCCFKQGSIIICSECDMSVSIDTKHLFNLLAAPCIPQIKHISDAMGNRFTHPTHQVAIYGGV